MEDKYYVPDLTEFRVGFRYEQVLIKEYRKFTFDPLDYISVMTVYDHNVQNEQIRVKALDESDILELGFVKVKETNYQKLLDNKDFYEIQYDEDGLVIELWKRKVDTLYDCFTLFEGKVKNYNELEVILKQIRV